MKQGLYIFLLLIFTACRNEDAPITDMRTDEEKNQVLEDEVLFEVEAENPEEPIVTTPVKNSRFSFRTIEVTQGWGYQIYEDSVLRINQMHIPSVPGTSGFETKERAEKAARYVVDQMNQGVFPPTVDPETLKKIGAID